MAPHNAYLAYKRDTKYLTFWNVHASNACITSSKADRLTATASINHTGQVKVSDLLSMAVRMRESAMIVPATIYRLFRSVIEKRLAVHAVSKEVTEERPDSDIERSNVSHRHFIDILEKAFEALGGETWLESNDYVGQQEERSLDELILANSFGALVVGADAFDGEESDAASDEQKVRVFDLLIPDHASLASLLTHDEGAHTATCSPQRSWQG